MAFDYTMLTMLQHEAMMGQQIEALAKLTEQELRAALEQQFRDMAEGLVQEAVTAAMKNIRTRLTMMHQPQHPRDELYIQTTIKVE